MNSVSKSVALPLLLILVIFASGKAAAEASCPRKERVSLERPLGIDGKSFAYTYEYTCKNPEWPTVIYIPGGPGLGSIGSDHLDEYPVNVIRTDPRGSGANADYWSAGGRKQDLSTEVVADDIRAIIESQELKNFVLHGNSFGTAVALVTASKLESGRSRFQPTSVILEGVVGRAERNHEQGDATRRVFAEIKREADFCLTCKLDGLRPVLTQVQIGNLVENLESGGKYLALAVLKQSSPPQLIEMAKRAEHPLNPLALQVYDAIACREYFALGIRDTAYEKGELAAVTSGSCKQKKLARPFDSKSWQVVAKTYYIVGTSDNFTPPAQARYAFDNQISKQKQVVCVAGGGHTPLDLNLSHCAGAIYARMISGLDVEPRDLNGCGATAQREAFTCGE